MPPAPATTQAATRPEAALPQATARRLHAFADLLLAWTRRINLVSAADQAQLWPRHIQDSLRLVPLIPAGTPRAIDIGSGAGFPGLVLAIATGIPFDLVESDRRKAAFLGEAIRVTQAPATVHAVRAEACALPPAPLVTARALAPLATLLGLAAPLLQPNGLLLLPKGARVEDEIAEARRTWCFGLVRHGTGAAPILAVTEPRPGATRPGATRPGAANG